MINIKDKTRQKGFTLIELILYVAILGSLLTGISMYFGMSLTTRVKNQSVAEVDRQGTLVLDYITQVIRNATSITSPVAGSNATSATFVVPTGSLSPTIFSLSGTTLQVQEGASTFALTNSKVEVSSLTFTNQSISGTRGIMRVSFVVSRANPSNINEYDYQKTFTASAALR